MIEKREYYSLAISPDNRIIAGGGNSGTGIFLWNFPDLTPLEPHRLDRANWVRGMEFNPNGGELATLSGLELTIWDTDSWKQKLSIAHPETVWSLAYSRDGNYLVTGGREVVRLRSTKSDYVEVDTRKIGINNDCWDAAFQPHGNQIAMGINKGVTFLRGPLISRPVDENTVKFFRVLTGISAISNQGQVAMVEAQTRSADTKKLQTEGTTFQPELIDFWAQWLIQPEKQRTVDPQSELTLHDYGAAKSKAILDYMILALMRRGEKETNDAEQNKRRERPSEWERENPRLSTVAKQLHAVRLELLNHDPDSAVVSFLNLLTATQQNPGEVSAREDQFFATRAQAAVERRRAVLRIEGKRMAANEAAMLHRVAKILELQGRKSAFGVIEDFLRESGSNNTDTARNR